MAYSKFSEMLYKQAQSWAGKWTKLANARLLSSPEAGAGAPKSLRSVIEVHTNVVRKSAQRFSLVLTAKGKGANVARYGQGEKLAGAYEYGARPHVIVPRPPKKYLSFYWEKQESWVKMKSVNHPGIVAANWGQGYIHSSAAELLRQGREELKAAGRKAILEDLHAAFKSGRIKK